MIDNVFLENQQSLGKYKIMKKNQNLLYYESYILF